MVKTQFSRVVVATAGLLAAIVAATAFLCMRQADAAAPVAQHGSLGAAAVAAATLALQTGELFTLADRHANDALRVVAQAQGQGQGPNGAGDALEWDYVQLRL
ncbi:hypothetical protein ACTMU2_06820 [Cupriavidus basilensis]